MTRSTVTLRAEVEYRPFLGQFFGLDTMSISAESNNQRDDGYSHKIPGLLGRTTKEVTGLPWDIRVQCPQEIVPLSKDYDQLKSDISDLRVADNTYIPSGLIWGQRVLSPGEPFDNSPGVGETENRKVMILMTDGNNTTEIRQDSAALEGVDRPPYIATLSDGVIAHNANETTASMCDNIKDSGIETYTIAFKVADFTTKTLLSNGASTPAKALEAESNAALIQRFEQIAHALSEDVRLIR